MREEATAGKLVKLARTYIVVIMLAALTLLFAALSPAFLTPLNLKNLFLQNTHMLVIVAGLSFITISGGMDLSIGYQISLVSVVTGWLLQAGAPPLGAAAVSLLAGMLCGLFNGLLVTSLDLVPFAATLASQLIFGGLSYMLSRGRTFSDFPAAFRALTRTRLLGVPVDAVLAVLCIVFVGFVFTYTFRGKHIKAIGDNERALRHTGINVRAIKISCYVIGSFFYAVAAMLLVSKQGVASYANGIGLEVTAIAAVFIGGVTSYRDRGIWTDVRVLNLVAGVFILAVIDNGIQLVGGIQYGHQLFIGMVLIVAMMLNRTRK